MSPAQLTDFVAVITIPAALDQPITIQKAERPENRRPGEGKALWNIQQEPHGQLNHRARGLMVEVGIYAGDKPDDAARGVVILEAHSTAGDRTMGNLHDDNFYGAAKQALGIITASGWPYVLLEVER